MANNNIINWSGYEWLPKEGWGDIHPDKSHWWYDKSAIEVDENNWIHLKTHYNPRYFEDLNIISPIGAGLISNTQKLSYGTFEIEAKLPTGKYLWPAFWMYPWGSWPPEIDVFEGYSNKNSSYFYFNWRNPLAYWNVKTNVYREDKTRFGPRSRIFSLFKAPNKHFNIYKVDWQPNRIDFYINNKKIRTIWYTSPYNYMNVIINNGIRNNKLDLNTNSDFVIKYFKHSNPKGW